MITAIVEFSGIGTSSPLSFSRFHNTEKETKESPEAWEKRTWKEKMHYDKEGNLFIPPAMIKNTIDAAAKYRSDKVPGAGKKTYTKHFEAGLDVGDPMYIGYNKNSKDIEGEDLFVPSNGIPGGGSRVLKIFPKIPGDWKGTVELRILDETITQDILKATLSTAGKFIGFGRYRPSKRGYYGRFSAEVLKWNDEKKEKK